MALMAEKSRVCVTGAGGYVASSLVKLLLSKDYIVHGTVRDPSDDKYAHLKNLDKAAENLKLFKADLLDPNSLAGAIKGCNGVFHVACPVPSGSVPNPEVELVEPAVNGTLNVLKACSEENIKRVVFVSSVAAASLDPNWPKAQVKDETCWSDSEYCKATNNWYCFSKTMAEKEAWSYAKKSGLDMVTVLPALVVGSMLQKTTNASSLALIKLLKVEYQMKRFFSPISSKLPQSSSSAQNAPQVEENLNQLDETHHSAKRFKQGVDFDSLPADPKKRIPIRDYHPDERDEIRRAYIQRGPHQPRIREFPQSDLFGLKRRFNRKWFKKYHDWLEYSVTEDAAYCLCCYLFQDESIHQGGGETFSSIGFRSWHKKKRLDTHIGKSNSVHNQAKKKCEDLMRQEQSIQAAFVKLSNQTKLEHKIRLKASIEVARLLLNQGLAFRGHREDESSLNKGNFLEILSWYAKRCDKIDELVLKKAPKNDQMTSHKIQKDIVTACKLETIKAIMEDLNGDYFSLLVDESCDISRKEQMAIVLRYVDRKGSVVERFIGIIHVHDTSALCLKEAIVNYLAQHSLSLSFIRGQCYDGASNMQGRLSGLKVLIQQQSKSAHAIHCFAHQLQLTLVGVSKKCLQVGELVLLVSNVLNVVGGSFKRMDELRESQAKKVQVALDMGEVESGKGLNQELGLARAANTRWGSHYKSFKNFISMFGSITDVLDTIVVDSESVEEKAKATGYLKVCQTFEIAFILHLMRDILAITNELNESLQKKEQDIANAILLVKMVKKRLQDLRNEGWDSLIENVSAFCVKYDILIPNFDEFYVNFGRSRRKVAEYTSCGSIF